MSSSSHRFLFLSFAFVFACVVVSVGVVGEVGAIGVSGDVGVAELGMNLGVEGVAWSAVGDAVDGVVALIFIVMILESVFLLSADFLSALNVVWMGPLLVAVAVAGVG
jgi:hypothetical protein